jgi:hypothetical protein
MSFIRRAAVVSVATVSIFAVGAGPALAHKCINPNKQGGAGAQLVVNFDDEIVWMSTGLEKRMESGVTTEENFHGLIGIDFDGDDEADMTTWIVGKYGEVPETAQYAGPACYGVTNFELYFSECVEQM